MSDSNTEGMNSEKFKKSTRYDVDEDLRFQCLIGNTKAALGIFIEPDPAGNGKGIHAHFHTTMRCPNMKIVDFPEPDRCKITDETCPFIAPLGSYERDPKLRKWQYAYKLVQMVALIEFYGSQLVNEILVSKGLPRAKNALRLMEVNRIMVASSLIGKRTYQKIDQLRRVRNKLAHDPRRYLEYKEKRLFTLLMEAQRLSDVIRRIALAHEEKI